MLAILKLGGFEVRHGDRGGNAFCMIRSLRTTLFVVCMFYQMSTPELNDTHTHTHTLPTSRRSLSKRHHR